MTQSFVCRALRRMCYTLVALLLAVGIVGCASKAPDVEVPPVEDGSSTSEEAAEQSTQEGADTASTDTASSDEEEPEPFVLHFNNYGFAVPDEWRDKVELRNIDRVVIGRRGLYFTNNDLCMILGFEDQDTYDWTHRENEYQPRLLGEEHMLESGNKCTDFAGLDNELGVWVRGNGREAVLSTDLYAVIEYGAIENNGVYTQEDVRLARATMASITGLPETTDSRTLTEVYLRDCAELVTFADDARANPPRDDGVPDIDDPEVHEKLNAFLSNFSESYFCAAEGERSGFDRDNATATQWVDLTFMNYLQNYGAGEECDETINDEWYNYRLPIEKLDETADHLCGRTADDWSQVNDEGYLYAYKDGYMYTQITNGFLLCGPSVATSVKPCGDGMIRVEFDACHQFAAETGYSLEGESLYDLSESEINARLGVAGPTKHGVAILEATYYTPPAASGWGYKLVRYELL